MKNIKKIFALIMAVCLMLCLCACEEDTEGTKEPAANATQAATDVATEVATEVPSEDPTPEPFLYMIKLVDEAGNPFAGVMVQLCKDTCMPAFTDENGVATFAVTKEAEGYKGAVTVLPEGYDHIQENVDQVVEEAGVTVYYYYFEDGSNELTITLKKIV